MTSTTYTLIVSKLEYLMVTLLTTEIPGGALDWKSSGLGGSGGAATTASLAESKADAMQTRLAEIDKTQQEVQADEKEIIDTAQLDKTKAEETAKLHQDKSPTGGAEEDGRRAGPGHENKRKEPCYYNRCSRRRTLHREQSTIACASRTL